VLFGGREKFVFVLTAQTGNEPIDVKIQVKKHILHRLRAHGIPNVQVTRAGHHESDGIVVLDDTPGLFEEFPIFPTSHAAGDVVARANFQLSNE
jgi:hypothetical protein